MKTIEDLPKSIKGLPEIAQHEFLRLFNKALGKHDEGESLMIAWNVIRPKFTIANGVWVARSEDFAVEELYEFKLDFSNEQLIQRSEDGDYLELDLPLASLQEHADGNSNDISLLQKFADQINADGIIGDFDHELFHQLAKKYSTEQVFALMKGKKGIAKSVSAYLKDNTLRLKMVYDKRYENMLGRVKGLSLEAYMKKDPTSNKFIDGKILGFTFNVNSNPADRGARIAI